MPQWLSRLKRRRKTKSTPALDTGSAPNALLPAEHGTPSQQPIDHRDSLLLHPQEEDDATRPGLQSQRAGIDHARNEAAATVHPQEEPLPPVVSNRVEAEPISSDHESSPPALGEKKSSQWPKVAYSTFKIGLDLTSEAANSFAPLKSAVGMLSVLLNNYDQTIDNRNKIEELVPKVKVLMDLLMDTSGDETNGLPPAHEYAEREMSRRREFRKTVGGVRQKLAELSQPHVLIQFLNNADQKGEIIGLVEDIREATMTYQTSLQKDLYEMNSDMYSMNQEQVESDYVNLLRELPCAKDAGYRSGNREPCLKGTRVELLYEIENWAIDEHEHPVFWLGGLAGVGKTTVAQSFAERAFAEGRLGASFFCSHGVADRSNIDLIFTTLAFELATQFHEFRPIIAKVIKDNPKVGHESLPYQLKKVLIDPLQHLVKNLKADPLNSTRLPIVFVIDALDECEDRRAESAVLSVLATQLESMDSVRFFITSRPVDQIRAAFRRPKLDKLTRRFQLHNVDQATIDRDMGLFFRTRLPKEVENREDFIPPDPWPAAVQVSSLVKNSGGLFIYASTILKYITSRDHEPDERLDIIISMVGTFLTGKLGIDQLYVQILTREFVESGDGDPNIFSDFKFVVGCILLVFNPVSRASLAKLLDKKSNYLLRVLRHLHSVLIIPEAESDLITAAHQSFPDFLTDQSRCDDNRFHIDRSAQHAVIGIRCLELMMKALKKNICSIPEQTLNKEVEDLPRLRQECIGDALEYACRFFGRHIRLAPIVGEEVDRIIELLKVFVERRLLQWLEVLSVVGDLRTAVHSLNDIKWWLVNAKVDNEDLLDSVIDCHRFVLKFYDHIGESAAYIYDAALPWCPVFSPLRQLYADEATTKVKVVKGLDPSWDQCSRTINTGDNKNCVVFSHDGRLIISAGSKKLQIYEAATGSCLKMIHESANCVAISPHDTLLVSASESAVKVWDLQTTELVCTLEGHTDMITSVAFSPSGDAVASGAHDGTVKIWSLLSGHCETIPKSSDCVRSICWYGNGDHIVSGLENGRVMVWDVLTKTCVKIIHDHPFSVSSLASSPDGRVFASASHVDSIIIYDAKTFDRLNTILVSEPVYSVSFSPKGDYIVHAAGQVIHVIDLKQQDTQTMFKGYESMVSSAVFSPDGSTIASASRDGNIKLWQCDGGASHDHANSSNMIISTCISADGQKIISGSVDETIMIWDANRGQCLETFPGPESNGAYAIALSPTASLVVSHYMDEQLRLWDYRDPGLNGTATVTTFLPFMRFTPDGSEMIASDYGSSSVERWKICLSPPGLRCLGTEQVTLEQPYRISDDREWILNRGGRRVCWLPPERRGYRFDCSESKVALGSDYGKLTILDFADVHA